MRLKLKNHKHTVAELKINHAMRERMDQRKSLFKGMAFPIMKNRERL